MASSSRRLYYLDSLKFIFCLMIFWTHFTGVFWTFCDPKPALRPELQLLFAFPLSVLMDSNLALYGFCILSGYLASFKKISVRNLLPQLFGRYLRFLIPFSVMNLLTMILYYTAGYPTAQAGALLHNSWLYTFYTHAPTVQELIRASLTLSGDLNGPLWMMKYILYGSCMIYIYNTAEACLRMRASAPSASAANEGASKTDEKSRPRLFRSGYCALRFFQLLCLGWFLLSFFHLPEPNFFHVHLVLFGLVLRKLDDGIKALLTRHSVQGVGSTLFFLVMAVLPVALDAGGLQNRVYPFFERHLPSMAPFFIWNAYWVMGFSFFLILGCMNCSRLQHILEWTVLRRLAPISFAIYLIHFPLMASLTLRLYICLVNRISYTKIFVLLTAVSFAALLLLSWLYERTLGRLQNRLVRSIMQRLQH